MTRLFPAALALVLTLTCSPFAHAQEEGPVPTQALVNVDAKSTPPASAAEISVTVADHSERLTAWVPVQPAHAQVALLLDSGLRESVGRELDGLKSFLQNLPPGIEVLVGYMQNGRVIADQPFTTDHAASASALHLPTGIPGMSASPYLCLSDFVKKWPSSGAPSGDVSLGGSKQHKARFVLMITNGVDPYNGSTSLDNQDSPYVAAAVSDAQRAGVAVYSIYFGDAGIRGESASLSGQSYLQQVSQGTGGVTYYQGNGNPVSMEPFLKMFQHALAETYVATFNAPAGKGELVRVKFSAPKTKLHAPEAVRPGNQE